MNRRGNGALALLALVGAVGLSGGIVSERTGFDPCEPAQRGPRREPAVAPKPHRRRPQKTTRKRGRK